MKIATIAPSYQRAEIAKTHLLIPGIRYAVHEFEADEYRDQGLKVVVIPDEKRGNIARVRNWILEEFAGSANLLIIDDDIEKVLEWHREGEGWNQHAMNPGEVAGFLEYGFSIAREWKVRLWGVNPATDKGSYREYTPFSTTSYISGSWHGILKCPLRYDEEIPLKEDYDFCLQELNDHRAIVRINWVSILKKDHALTGGCAEYRNLETENEQFEAFQLKWGSKIVRRDGGEGRTHRKKEKGYDLNPIIKPPIKGV